MIIDATKEMYPKLDGAKFLEYRGSDVPEELTVTFSNVLFRSDTGKDYVSDVDCDQWGWHNGVSFTGGFETPKDAIDNYLEWKSRVKE